MHRIIVSTPPVHGLKVWAGDWFKKEYGFDMTEGAERRVKERREYEAEVKKLKEDGVNITHQSRQVGGDKRIRMPDKDKDS